MAVSWAAVNAACVFINLVSAAAFSSGVNAAARATFAAANSAVAASIVITKSNTACAFANLASAAVFSSGVDAAANAATALANSDLADSTVDIPGRGGTMGGVPSGAVEFAGGCVDGMGMGAVPGKPKGDTPGTGASPPISKPSAESGAYRGEASPGTGACPESRTVPGGAPLGSGGGQ
jgi:hypothetical protein